ncbi:hypothetical protein DID88_001965 [Monilinia fructigena]|uniref:Uncharacterized protein n=1 Tax=Monilinia fructigena TaxID=38457 RepID=A0A395IW28_9HELO|nr:hypothetical protein DID88_001965 [Monilinia fructigena]
MERKEEPFFGGQCFSASDKENDVVAANEQDSDEDDEDERHQEVKPMLSSNTLKSVKSRLKKTFSRESGITKKNNKKRSVGTSEEELERRKELRRLRQKRIEEELSYDDEYDKDAQSMSTVDRPTTRIIGKGKKRQSILPEDSGNFPVFRKGAHLRKLSQKFEVPIQSATDIANVGTQTLPYWLKMQGPGSSARAITTSESSTVNKEPLPMRLPRSDTGFGGVDGSGSFFSCSPAGYGYL